MKTKITLALATFILATNFVFSQESETKKLNFGLDVIPAITWLNINNPQVQSDGSKIKLNGGLNIYFNLGDSYAIVTGLRYNTYGGKLQGTKDNIVENISYKFREIEIPVGLKLRTKAIGSMRYVAHLNVGAGFEIKPGASRTDATDTNLNYENNVGNYKLLLTRALYNLGLGVEYDLQGIVLTGRINYKGWFTPLYFYVDDITTATKQLNLAPPAGTASANIYDTPIKFKPSAFELAIGVLF